MKTTPYRTIRDGVIQRMGIDPAQSLLPSQASAIAEYATTAAALAWGFYDWPDTTQIEQRAVVAGSIALYQTGLTPIGAVSAVYASDPAATGIAVELEFVVTDDALTITDAAYTTGDVYVFFALPIPRFTDTAFSSGTTYAKGDLVYYNTTGDCYEAIQATTGNLPTDTTFWLRHRIPTFLADYIKFYAVAETLAEDGQYDKSQFQFVRAEGVLMQRMDDAWLRRGEVRRYSATFQ
jgi:hypothetical protein